jgi:hypothetical protein
MLLKHVRGLGAVVLVLALLAMPTAAAIGQENDSIEQLRPVRSESQSGEMPETGIEEAGPDPSQYERVEVPEAGIAMAFPPDWNVDVEMREREDFWLSERFPEAAPVLFWNVLYASPGGRPWCDVTWYPAHPTSLAEHAIDWEALMTPDGDVERSIEVQPIEVGAGSGYRFVVWNEPTDDYRTVYLLESGTAHYLVECVSDTRREDDWLTVAESIELWEAAP